MKQEDDSNIKPQEVITIFRNISEHRDSSWTGYPELEEFFNKGYYIEDFKQTLLGEERYMITFTFRKFSR
ncbi:MAG TPA: hypothetical protein VI112_17100 [Bacteroidia bacterium]|jgi:hypothetical protein